MLSRRRFLSLAASAPLLTGPSWAAEWAAIEAEARSESVYFNAWAGSETINAYIAWAGGELEQRFGIKLKHVKIADAAEAAGLKVMVGCMLSTSLGIAPAFVLAQCADWVDLDGPALLAADRENGFKFEGGMVIPPS